MIWNAILDGPLDSAAAHGLPISDLIDPGGIEHLEILEWIAVDDDEIGAEARPDASELGLLAEDARVVEGRVLNDLDGVEAGFLMQLELTQEAEAVHLVDEPRVLARAHDAAFPLELAHGPHPDAVVLLPERLVRGRPAEEVRAVVGR